MFTYYLIDRIQLIEFLVSDYLISWSKTDQFATGKHTFYLSRSFWVEKKGYYIEISSGSHTEEPLTLNLVSTRI